MLEGGTYEPKPGFILIGQVSSSWGLKGEVRVYPLTDFPERFSAGNSFLVDGVKRKIEWTKSSKGGVILKLEGINSPEEALELRHKTLEIPENELHELPEGVYYQFQIIGLEVWSISGDLLGKIREILTTAANDIYVMESAGKDVLIPAIPDVVKSIDLESGKITIEPIEGLLN